MPGSLKVLACYLMWAFLVLYWPLFGAMDPLAVLSFRIIFSMLFCLIVMLILGQGPAILALMKDKRQMLFLLLAGITITVNWGGYIIAVMTGRVIDASLAYYMYPIFSIVLGFFIYNERLRPLQGGLRPGRTRRYRPHYRLRPSARFRHYHRHELCLLRRHKKTNHRLGGAEHLHGDPYGRARRPDLPRGL